MSNNHHFHWLCNVTVIKIRLIVHDECSQRIYATADHSFFFPWFAEAVYDLESLESFGSIINQGGVYFELSNRYSNGYSIVIAKHCLYLGYFFRENVDLPLRTRSSSCWCISRVTLKNAVDSKSEWGLEITYNKWCTSLFILQVVLNTLLLSGSFFVARTLQRVLAREYSTIWSCALGAGKEYVPPSLVLYA